MAEAKKARAKSPKSLKTTEKAAPARKAPVTAKADASADEKAASHPAVVASTQSTGAVKLLPLTQERGAILRQAVSDAVAVTARGALEVNDKIIEAMQAQSNAAIELWRTALNTPHLPDVIRAQTSGTRRAYETASAQWTDIATTTAQWFNKSLEPLQSALHQR